LVFLDSNESLLKKHKVSIKKSSIPYGIELLKIIRLYALKLAKANAK